jgi:iron complex outermembrane receptor protein
VALGRIAIAASLLGIAYGQRVGVPTDDLTNLGAEELFKIQVTSVGRKAQQLSKAPAAVFVLTAEDIRRSGATSIPEALQLVPGLTVLRVDGRVWIVSARGAARVNSENMLVMIDGGSLYMPLFSGVMWEVIDLPVDQIAQIEVVRGPGAVMWGPNAVNGVINIITKKATDSLGLSTSVGAGNDVRPQINLTWGAKAGDRVAYQISATTESRYPAYDSPGYYIVNSNVFRTPSVHNLDERPASARFRVDANPTARDQVMVEGVAYTIDKRDPVAYANSWGVPYSIPGHSDYKGGYLGAAWTRKSSAGSEGVLRFSYNKAQPDYPFMRADIDNLTVDYQHRWQTGERNELYLGGGFQQYSDSTTGQQARFTPASSVYRSGNAVVRDEWQFVPGRLLGSAGVRLDFDSYHHFEYQPSFRLMWTPTGQQSAWIAFSRAVRSPSRFDRDVQLNFGNSLVQGIPISVISRGSPQQRSEVERSVETGYRIQSGQRWSLDTSVFWSYYTRLRAWSGPLLPVIGVNSGVLTFTLPLSADNAGRGRSYGGEIWGVYQASPGWKIIPSYSYLNETRWLPGQQYYRYQWDTRPATVPHQGLIRSQHNLSRTLQSI